MRPHYAVWQNATHCSFATQQKLRDICRQSDCVHLKKEFFADLLQVTKTVERNHRTLYDFFLKLADTILKPLTHHMLCSFLWWDRNLPIKFLGHAASNGVPQPCRRNIHIYLQHGVTFAACLCVLHGIVWMYL